MQKSGVNSFYLLKVYKIKTLENSDKSGNKLPFILCPMNVQDSSIHNDSRLHCQFFAHREFIMDVWLGLKNLT